jgi:hypothetical protein
LRIVFATRERRVAKPLVASCCSNVISDGGDRFGMGAALWKVRVAVM